MNDSEAIFDYFTPNNTSVRIADGVIVSMDRVYVP